MNSATMISLSRDLLFRINCRITFEAKIVNKIGGPESWGSTGAVPFLPYTPCIVHFQRRLKYNSGGKWLLYTESLYVEEGAPVPTKKLKVGLLVPFGSVRCPRPNTCTEWPYKLQRKRVCHIHFRFLLTSTQFARKCKS